MESYGNLIGTALTIVGILITLIVPIPLKEEYRFFIVSVLISLFLIIILLRFDSRLESSNRRVEEFNKRFKTMEELNDLRLDIRELKRMVFK